MTRLQTAAKDLFCRRFMHDGYQADDIYMLVEDEFQTVAQSFTRHLHHAEYVRMKEKARDAPHTVPEPVNGMRPETKQRLQAQALHARQRSAVKGMVQGAAPENSSEEDEAKEDDPSLGTSLAGLMAADGNHKKTALVGLEKISSSTRAAHGFSSGARDSSGRRTEKKSILEIFGGRQKKGQEPATQVPEYFEEDEEDDGDLESPPKPRPLRSNTETPISGEDRFSSRPAKHAQRLSERILQNGTPQLELVPVSQTRVECSRLASRFPTMSARRTIGDFDDFDEDLDDLPPHPKPVFGGSMDSVSRRNIREKDKKARLQEVPTFIV